MKTSKAERRWQECPTAWFAILERSRENGDQHRVNEALRELRHLGVIVIFTSDDAPKNRGDAA